MDYYEQHLLGLAVEECAKRDFLLSVYPPMEDGFYVETFNGSEEPPDRLVMCGEGDTLAEALAALLTDMGVTVPERPSTREVRAAYLSAVPLIDAAPCSFTVGRLRDIFDREPLTVLALLAKDGAS